MSSNPTARELVAACHDGDRRAASKLISRLESHRKGEAEAASEAVSSLPLPEHVVGLTGPPGAGKSSLLDYFTGLYRARGCKVAVLAVDPSSPFTGGALLGDRIRMGSHSADPGVFIRSMGSRGALGGLAAAARDALRVLACAGFNKVLLETVGAGQAETEVVNQADTVCVVQVPGLGDDVQLMKMGILEVADIFLVNKADKPEAALLQTQIQQVLHDSPPPLSRVLRQLGRGFTAAYTGASWEPPVLLLSAQERTGGEAFVEAAEKHLAFLRQPVIATALRRERLVRELIWRAGRRFQERLLSRIQCENGARLIEDCAEGKLSLDAAAQRLAAEGPLE